LLPELNFIYEQRRIPFVRIAK